MCSINRGFAFFISRGCDFGNHAFITWVIDPDRAASIYPFTVDIKLRFELHAPKHTGLEKRVRWGTCYE